MKITVQEQIANYLKKLIAECELWKKRRVKVSDRIGAAEFDGKIRILKTVLKYVKSERCNFFYKQD